MKIETALEDFDLANKADGLSPATMKWYRSILKPLLVRFAGADSAVITTKQLREYVVEIRERTTRYQGATQRPQTEGGLAKESIDGHIRAIKRFFEWCAGEYEHPNPSKGIKRSKPAPREPKAIDEKDFVSLFNATQDTSAGIRDRALLAVLADTGCRLGGLLSMKLPNLEVQRRRVRVFEKGATSRWVYFTHYTTGLVQLWLQTRKSETDALWIAMDTHEALTQSGVHEILKRLKERAGVTGRVNPHSFRHNFAREYIRSGGDAVTLSRLLGHTLEVTAAYYAVFAPDELQEFHDKHTPMKEFE